MQSHHLITWLIIGVIAGALAGRVIEGRGLGCLADLVVGVAGAVVGGVLLDRLDPGVQFGTLGEIVVAFIGACILLAFLKLLAGGKPLGGGRALR